MTASIKSLLIHITAVAVAVAGVLSTIAAVAPSVNVPAQWTAAITAASVVITVAVHLLTGILNPAGPSSPSKRAAPKG